MPRDETPPDSNPSAPPVPVPDGWTAERDGGTLTLHSPDTCFWTFTAIPGGPAPAEAADSAVVGLREEYPDLETEPVAGPPLAAGEAALDAAFFCLDSTAAARVRAFTAAGVTYLVFYQGLDGEVDRRREELETLGRQAARAVNGAAPPPTAFGTAPGDPFGPPLDGVAGGPPRRAFAPPTVPR